MFNVVKVGKDEWRVHFLPSNRCITELNREQLEDLTFKLEVAIIEEDVSEENCE